MPIREAVICARLLQGQGVGGRDRKRHFIRLEEQRNHAGDGAGHSVRPRTIVRVVRSGDQRLPVRVAFRAGITVAVSFLNGRDGSSGDVVPLGVPSSDSSIGHRHVGEGE